MAGLPAYKATGAGAMVDFKNLQVGQIIAWGSFKSRFVKMYTDVAGTETINGHEVFKDLEIHNYLDKPESDVYEFLKLYGFTEKDLESMDETYKDGDNKISKMILAYHALVTISSEAFVEYIDQIFDVMTQFTHVEISVINRAYELEIPDEDLDDAGQSVQGFFLYTSQRNFDTGMGRGPAYSYSADNSNVYPRAETMDLSLGVKMYNGAQEVTSNYSKSLGIFIALMIGDTGAGITPDTETRTISEKNFILGDGPKKMKQVVLSERFNVSLLDKNAVLAQEALFYSKYSDNHECDYEEEPERCDSLVYTSTWTSIMWITMSSLSDENTEEVTEGLFTSEEVPEIDEGMIVPKAYMIVDSIKSIKPNVFGFYVSEYMNIKIIQDKGGIITRIFAGLIKVFLSLIDAVIGVFLKIPVLKQMTEILLATISKVFGIDKVGAREVLKQIILAVIVIVITIFLPPVGGALAATAGAGATAAATTVGVSAGVVSALSQVIQYSSYAMQIYNAGMNGKAIGELKQRAKERANKDYLNRKRLDDANNIGYALNGTMGSHEQHESQDYLMYTAMFNPLDNMPQAVPPGETKPINLF